jgi:hypothetical protein
MFAYLTRQGLIRARPRPRRLAAAGEPAGQDPQPGRASRLAGHRHSAGMRPGPAHGAGTTGGRVCAARRDQPGPAGRDGGAGTAGSRAPRRAARGVHPPAPLLPAADQHAHRGLRCRNCPGRHRRAEIDRAFADARQARDQRRTLRIYLYRLAAVVAAHNGAFCCS